MRRFIPVVVAFLGLLTCVWAGDQDPPADPWQGKTRLDVTTVLGDPTKTKRSGDGELLIYKLVRLEEGSIAPPGMTLMNVPGIGVAGRMPPPSAMKDLEIRPTEIDAEGHAQQQGQTYNMTWDKDKKKFQDTGMEERPTIKKKITLKLLVGPNGVVQSWSVSPKKAAEGS